MKKEENKDSSSKMMMMTRLQILVQNLTVGLLPAKKLNVILKINIEKIQDLKAKKKQQQDWDKYTKSQKSSITNIDEKIAKNIADEVLRNYPNMSKIHSNVSIRKLLEA